MAQQRRKTWLTSLWICDAEDIEQQHGRDKPAWTTVCGPLTILARSQRAFDLLQTAPLGASWPVTVRLAGNREETGHQLGRFAATANAPYVHVVAGTFDYDSDMADLLREELAATPRDLIAVDCARINCEAYSFPARSLCSRFGLATGRDLSLSDPPLDSLVFARGGFVEAVNQLMRVPPDAGWLALALAGVLAAQAPPVAVPLLLGSWAAAAPIGDGAGWSAHAAGLVAGVLTEAADARSDKKAARRLVDLARLLMLVPVMHREMSDYVEERAARLAPGLVAGALVEAAQHDQGLLELYIHLCDALLLEGPDTLELTAEDCAAYLRQQLLDLAALEHGSVLAAIAGQVARGKIDEASPDPVRARLRDMAMRLKQANVEKRMLRAAAATANDALQMEQFRLRQERARYERLQDQELFAPRIDE